MTTTCHVNLMDYLSFGKLFKITDKQKRKLSREVSSDGVKQIAKTIFNKNNKMFVTVLGNITKSYVPKLEELKNKFFLGE